MQESQKDKKQVLQEKHPHKHDHIEALLVTCAKFENETVWEKVYIELEGALEEEDHHKLTLLENMVRRMKTMHEEEQRPPVIKPNRRRKILIIVSIIAFALLAFYLFKQA